MNAKDLLEQYERVVEAPDAITNLRQFVLDLAIRGKLVAQEPTDEPAGYLLKRIAQAKIRAVSKPARARAMPEVEAPPFLLPDSWSWTTIAEIGLLSPKNEADDNLNVGFVPMPLIAAPYGAPNGHEVRKWGEVKKGYTHFAEGDVGLAKITPCFENGKSTVFRNLPGGLGSGTTELHVVRPLVMNADFVALYLKSPHFINGGIPRMTGTAGQKRVPFEYFAYSPFPLPPHAEQQRIVSKVDELMALCDQLEKARAVQEEKRDKLTAATLARLNTPNPETFHNDARFALDNLQPLTTRADQIKQLRQTVLSLAVQGKLVSQDPNDGSAETILAAKLDAPAGHQRGRKILKRQSVDAPPGLFPELPKSWSYARIQDLYDRNIVLDYADGNHGSLYPRASEFGDTGVTFVSAKDIVDGRVTWASCAKLNNAWADKLKKGWAKGGDVLLTHNATVGRVGRVDPGVPAFLLGTSVTYYRLNPNALDADFFFYTLQSPLWQGQLEAIMAQTTRNQVSIQKQAFFRIAIPPLPEQRRIVIKLEAVMALCGQLESSLATADETRRGLLQAVLAEALLPVQSEDTDEHGKSRRAMDRASIKLAS